MNGDATKKPPPSQLPPTLAPEMDWRAIRLAETERKRAFGFIDQHKFQAEHEFCPRSWAVEGLVPIGEVTLLTGDGGLGKSLLAQMMGVSLALGEPWLGFPVYRLKSCFPDEEEIGGTAICIFCEDDDRELLRRQTEINRHFGIQNADLSLLNLVARKREDNFLVRRSSTNPTELKTTEFYEELFQIMLDESPTLIILDSLHDFFAGDENDRLHARFFVKILNDIAWNTDSAVVIIGHPSVSGIRSGAGFSGSTGWHNAVRSRLYLTEPDPRNQPNLRHLTVMKANYGPKGQTIRLEWRNGVFVNLDAPSVATPPTSDAATIFLAGLAELTRRRIAAHARPGKGYASKAIAALPLARGHSITALKAAMDDLLATGRIEVGPVWRKANRHFQEGLRVAGHDPEALK